MELYYEKLTNVKYWKKLNASDNCLLKDGQDHKDKYFDNNRKTMSQEMTICILLFLIFIFFGGKLLLIPIFFNWSKGFVHAERSYMYHKYLSCIRHSLNGINKFKVSDRKKNDRITDRCNY